MKGTKQNFIRVNHRKDITPLQEMMIDQFLESTHSNLKERSKQTYKVDLRSYLLGDNRNARLIKRFTNWLSQNRITLVERKVTPQEIEELTNLLNRISDVSSNNTIVTKDGDKVMGNWVNGILGINKEEIGEYKAFTFWVDYGEEAIPENFSIVITKDSLYNAFMAEITLQEIKDFIKDFNVVETNPLSDYL